MTSTGIRRWPAGSSPGSISLRRISTGRSPSWRSAAVTRLRSGVSASGNCCRPGSASFPDRVARFVSPPFRTLTGRFFWRDKRIPFLPLSAICCGCPARTGLVSRRRGQPAPTSVSSCQPSIVWPWRRPAGIKKSFSWASASRPPHRRSPPLSRPA